MSIARERIQILFEQASEKAFQGNKGLADRYVELARKIGMKSQESIPKNLQRNFCSNCGSFWIPGNNCHVRIDSKNNHMKYTCKECGETGRYVIKQE